MMSTPDQRNANTLADLQRQLITLSNRVRDRSLPPIIFFRFSLMQSQQQRDRLRPILVEKQAQNELLDSSANWLISTMKQLTGLSTEPISVQYDQVSNRLKEFLTETESILSQIEHLNSSIHDDPSFEANRLQLISHLQDTEQNIHRIIDDREQIQTSVQTLDQTVGIINQNIKLLRNNLEQFRIANNDSKDLQVKSQTSKCWMEFPCL